MKFKIKHNRHSLLITGDVDYQDETGVFYKEYYTEKDAQKSIHLYGFDVLGLDINLFVPDCEDAIEFYYKYCERTYWIKAVYDYFIETTGLFKYGIQTCLSNGELSFPTIERFAETSKGNIRIKFAQNYNYFYYISIPWQVFFTDYYFTPMREYLQDKMQGDKYEFILYYDTPVESLCALFNKRVNNFYKRPTLWNKRIHNLANKRNRNKLRTARP